MRPIKFYEPNQKTIVYFLVLQSWGWFQNIYSYSGPTPIGSGTIPYTIPRNFGKL